MRFLSAENAKVFSENIWKENPIFRQILGICSTLAVTNLVFNTMIMCVGLIFATIVSNVLVSSLRQYIGGRIRMIAQVILIAVPVTVMDLLLQTFLYDTSKQLGAYVGLIITNCIVMGRAEVFAMKNSPWPSFWDAVGAGFGYSMVLLAIAVPRELLGFGTIMGYQVFSPETWVSWNIMIMPPGAFFMLAAFIWIVNSMTNKKIGQEGK